MLGLLGFLQEYGTKNPCHILSWLFAINSDQLILTESRDCMGNSMNNLIKESHTHLIPRSRARKG